jgi:sialic acid synthase SpsE/sugar phosphate isomerase/epimerase
MGRRIGDDEPVFVIAEIGLNHNGDPALAHKLVDAAADAGADCAKFQMRDLASLYRNDGRVDDAGEDLGSQYVLDLLTRFELEPGDMFELFDHCVERGLVPLCTPWDPVTVERLEEYGLPGYKVASADLTNHDLLHTLASTYRPLLVSTGMSTDTEISESVELLISTGTGFALLHCNSTYPAPYADINLRYLTRLRELGRCPVGYSGHERGWHLTVAAVALGASIIEKHFTLDRTMEGNDHKVSLLPAELAAMVEAIHQTSDALGSGRTRTLSQGEMMNRVTLAKSLVATRDIGVGEVITDDAVATKSPGRGVQPNRRGDLIGRIAQRPIKAGGFLYPSDLETERVGPRPYSFRRPWGVPVRYHDTHRLLGLAHPDFVEFHLSYKDLDLDPADHLEGPYDAGYAVHSPDLFANDHILDLATDDADHRRRSLVELARVAETARALGAHFTGGELPVLIVSVGGFTADRPLPAEARRPMYERVARCLDEVDLSGLRVTAQTMPPFPWLLGGQLHHNLFVDPDDSAWFCETFGARLCLDLSHTKLAATHRHASFAEWVEQLGPHVDHLHVVDAAGVDGEGLQIGEGEIDFGAIASQLDRLAPAAGFIPEIWQGHNNDGEGFWIALDRLEQWF